MEITENSVTLDLSIDDSFNENKKYLALEIAFNDQFEFAGDVTTICLILIDKFTGIVYCMYPLTVDDADPVFYDTVNPRDELMTTNIFNNLGELESFSELHYNTYSKFFNEIENGLSPTEIFSIVNQNIYEEELEELYSQNDINQDDIDFNYNNSFCNIADINLYISRYNNKYITHFYFGFEEDETESLINTITTDGRNKSKNTKRLSKSKKRSKRRSKKRSKKRSKRRSNKRSKSKIRSKRRSKKRSKSKN